MQTIRLCAASAAALTFAAFTPLSGASAHDIHLHLDDHEELLEQLIELDAEGIEDLRDDFAEAREDIADAIVDIQEAKEDVKEAPIGGMVANIAFRTASATVTKAAKSAFKKVHKELNQAETELDERRADVGEAEYVETSGAIAMIREELKGVEEALSELTSALKET